MSAVTRPPGFWNWFGLTRGRQPRCGRCGLAVERAAGSGRARVRINPETWAKRCKEVGKAAASPFQGPHLKAALRARP